MKLRKIFGALLALAMFVTILPTSALASNDVVTVTSGTTEWTDGKTYVVSGDVTISSRITVSGNVTLQLMPGSTLNMSKIANIASLAGCLVLVLLSLLVLKFI